MDNLPLPTRNWWQRNWKWFVPTGCVLLLLLLVILGAVLLLLGKFIWDLRLDQWL